jgi:hypothetical protein
LQDLGPGLKVGLCWRGGRSAQQGEDRQPPLCSWHPVLRIPGVQFVSLQHEGVAALGQLRDQVHELLPSSGAPLDELAALIGALDLVISVPGMAAHLAGALGTPVWVPLPSWPSWRWGLEGEACPWYPSMRLFRQRRRGGWDDLLADVAGHLRNAETATCAGK